MGKKETIGQCRLCLQERKLCNSHIIPDFFLRFLHKDEQGNDQSIQLVSSDPQKPILERRRGSWEHICKIKEYLLCAKCESKFSLWEKYIKEILYEKKQEFLFEKNSIPIRDILKPHFKEIETLKVDYQKFKLFQLSLLWRASISQKDYFTGVQLGSKHEEKLRKMLYDENPGKWYEYPCALCSLESDEIDYKQITRAPHGNKKEVYHYFFLLGGYIWFFEVSSHLQKETYIEAIKENGFLNVLVLEADRAILPSLKKMLDG